jgi:hypothetical protein
MTYPTPEPPPTDPPLAPQQPYVPGSNLPGYQPPPETHSYSPAPGATPDVPGYGPPPGAAPDAYGYSAPQNYPPQNYAPQNYGYGTPGAYGYGAPAAPGPDGYGYGAPAGYGTPQAYYPMYPYGYAPARETEGLAIASLVVSCAAVLGVCTWGIGGVLGIVGAVLGHVARRRIRQNGKNGDGMALAGIIVGWVLTAICAALAVVIIVLIAHDSGSTESI